MISIITSSRSYAYTDEMRSAHPEATAMMAKGEQYKVNTRTFELLPFLFSEEKPEDGKDYIQVLGLIKNKRYYRWIRKEFIAGPRALSSYKVAVTAANGSGALGEALSTPLVVEPDVAMTQTFMSIGNFDSALEAKSCLNYVKTKFARTMLGVLKITQHNPARTWQYVPMQDFTADSDIDWSMSVDEIDQQLYRKYQLSPEEIDFIESNVKAMD